MNKSKLGQSATNGGCVDSERARAKSRSASEISTVRQQEVIRRADGRCQMCGCTVAGDGATLIVDDSKPLNWGGPDDQGDLWAICEPCCAGTKEYFSSMHVDAELMRRVTSHRSVHVRIGELLKAFGIGNRVCSSLIKAVADQGGWQKRLRELRYPVIGWEIEVRLYSEPSGKKHSDYVLISDKPWPEDPTGAVRRFEGDRRRQARATAAARCLTERCTTLG